MNASPYRLVLLSMGVLLAPLQAGYIRTITFGYNSGPSFSTEYGNFCLQYESGFDALNGQNHSIDWMTMTVGANTRDLVRDKTVVAAYFGFAFYPATGQLQICGGPDYLLGCAPGFFIYKINAEDFEIRQTSSSSIGSSTAVAPINYFHVGDAKYVPESGSTGAMMLGGLACLGLAARSWRRKASGFKA